ncbi:MAG: ATP-binding protein [Candidatus Omnitrophota bacterium]
MLKRQMYTELWQTLSSEKQMIFLTGPRQSGKTTLSKEIIKNYPNNIYFNWDIIPNKKMLIDNPTFFEQLNRVDSSRPLIVLDEIHKYVNWKNYLKSIYDQFKDEYLFLVSGSGRLDVYQKGGDSLAGRYFIFHLFPFTAAELSTKKREFNPFVKDPLRNFALNPNKSTKKVWDALFTTGGFPEPFIKASETFLIKWSTNYFRQIIREDIRNFADIKRVDTLELLFSLLPSRIGSPLSINSLARDVQSAFDSVRDWLKIFESLYLIFRIPPWTKKIKRAILKEKKLYLFHHPAIQDDGAKFENMVALELLRAINNWNDSGFGVFTLHYIRNKDKQEVDFLIADRNKPLLLIEVKLSEDKPSKNLLYFQNILNVPAVQVVHKEDVYKYIKNGENHLLIITAHRWLSSLP